MKNSKIEKLLQREQLLAFFCLAIVIAISWTYMLHMSRRMSGTGTDITLACLMRWGPGDIAHSFVMWAIMMVAMMFPSAAPMTLMFSIVNRQQGESQRPIIPMGLFVLGYFLVWTSYSLLASLAQWGLHVAALLSHDLVITSSLLGGILLIAAGIFQWTPLRDACMSKCRSPLGFLMAEWREGRGGALIMGLRHGVNCVGCCWLLMLLSFVLGIMNMVWMAVLTVFMLIEKTFPGGHWVSRTAGLILVVWGIWVTAEALH